MMESGRRYRLPEAAPARRAAFLLAQGDFHNGRFR
jgi:hypothetical protein